jgi:Cytochrome P460
MLRRLVPPVIALAALLGAACSSMPTPTTPSAPVATPAPTPQPPSPSPNPSITSDAALLALVTGTQPFSAYALFPDLNAGSDGILTASSAHQPLIRVRLNAVAASVLQDGRLPEDAVFPDGSILFKEVLSSNRQPDIYAIMYKDRNNRNAGNGWLWAEYRPTGAVGYSITNNGSACTSCHSLGRGRGNDFVRIFERQR